MFVSFLFVFDVLLILFRLAWWPSARKELSSWLFAFAVLFCAVLIICVPFLSGVWGGMWKSIVSVPGHCLFIYFSYDP